MWVVDFLDGKIYAYQMPDKTRDASKDFNTLSGANNNFPTGIWSDGDTMWVADFLDGKIYAYQMPDKTRDDSKDFNTLSEAENNSPTGIWSDGTTMWVADPDGDKIYAYQMSDKTRDTSKEFNTLSGASNNEPIGIWSDGATMWVADIEDDKVYSYNMPEVVLGPEVTVMFGQGSYAVAEGGTRSVTVTLSADPERTATIPITPTNQGGASSADYSGVPDSVTFNSGQTSRSFTFTATQDTDDDDGESVKLTFGTLPNRVSAGTTHETTISITDDDTAPPSAPTNFRAAAGDRRVTLSWDDPGNSSITKYQHRYRSITNGAWNPDWTDIPGSGATTTSYTVMNLANSVNYTFEVRAMAGGVAGAESRSTATPEGPPSAPGLPGSLNIYGQNERLTLTWRKPSEDERAPVTSYHVRYRQVGAASWRNVSRHDDDLRRSQTITGLTNRRAYEVQVAAVNRIGTGAWASGKGTPQAPKAPPPEPAGDEAFDVGRLAAHWTDLNADENLLRVESCTGSESFRVIWAGPGDDRRADQWAAHINTGGGAGAVSYSFRESGSSSGYFEMRGTVDLEGPSSLSIRIRGRFGANWGKWSPPVGLYCFETE